MTGNIRKALFAQQRVQNVVKERLDFQQIAFGFGRPGGFGFGKCVQKGSGVFGTEYFGIALPVGHDGKIDGVTVAFLDRYHFVKGVFGKIDYLVFLHDKFFSVVKYVFCLTRRVHRKAVALPVFVQSRAAARRNETRKQRFVNAYIVRNKLFHRVSPYTNIVNFCFETVK